MDPQQIGYLLALAGLSLAFVGFSTIVVTLRQGFGLPLSAFDSFLVRYFIETGFALTAGALLPPLFGAIGLDATSIWVLSSAIAALFMLLYSLVFLRRRRRLQAGRLPARLVMMSVSSVAALVGLILNAGGWLFPPGAPAYIIAISWILIQEGLLFLGTLTLYIEPHPGGNT